MRNQLVPMPKKVLVQQPDELDKLDALFLQEAGSELTPVITSFQTAELLEKRHAHVLRDIENILFHVSDNFAKITFSQAVKHNRCSGFAMTRCTYLLATGS